MLWRVSGTSFEHLLKGTFHFLRPTAEEVRRVFPEGLRLLPTPYPIYLEDESATPFQGFPVLMSEGAEALREALAQYIEVEEEAQLKALRREPFPRTAYASAWERYRALLIQAVENATLSSYGRHYPTIFWLHHSLDIARRLRESPKRVLRFDVELGRRHGDQIKYRVFEKLADQVRTAVYETVNLLAPDLQEGEEDLSPRLLARMFENVLIFTEEQVSGDLAELSSYLNGYLRIDARELRGRLDRLAAWHAQALADDPELRAIAAHLLGMDPDTERRHLLTRPGWLSVLAQRQTYDPGELLPPFLVQVWETLLGKLREFEILNALRALLLPVRREGPSRLVFRAGGLDRTWVGQRLIYLSPATRPLDFMSPSVIDPLVHRFGLIYDISDFSEVVSVLRRAGTDQQEQAFRQMFRFQRRINRLAGTYRLQLEKYLGDGAFYTSRQPLPSLLCAIHLQRLYRCSLDEGLPFDHGMRIGLNFGHYRLFPIQSGGEGEPDRYEFFGHGVVELSRLASGKGTQELEEIKHVLISYGYPRQTVLRFFEPLVDRNLDVVDRGEETRRFFAYINRNGSLINEGIVATGEYIRELAQSLSSPRLYRGQQASRTYVVLSLPDGEEQLWVGLRRLGVAHLKGLDDLPVYEIVDGSDRNDFELVEIEDLDLLPTLDRLAAAGVIRSAARPPAGPGA
jgi:hypothetical protein